MILVVLYVIQLRDSRKATEWHNLLGPDNLTETNAEDTAAHLMLHKLETQHDTKSIQSGTLWSLCIMLTHIYQYHLTLKKKNISSHHLLYIYFSIWPQRMAWVYILSHTISHLYDHICFHDQEKVVVMLQSFPNSLQSGISCRPSIAYLFPTWVWTDIVQLW